MSVATKPVLNKVTLAFLKKIVELCGGPRPSVRNTTENPGGMSYKVKVTNTNDYGAERYLQSLGFVSSPVQSTGGSTHGDFSSDAYGIILTHPSGVRVRCSSWFGTCDPYFSVIIHGTPEQIALLK